MIEIVRACDFRAKPCGLCGLPRANRVHSPKRTATCPWKRRNGCAACGKAKGHRDHFGEPPSFNLSAGRDPMAYRNIIERWKALLGDLLSESGLPPAVYGRVYAEGEATFPGPRRRDQGNFRVVIEKALGDALVDGGWLPDDTWDHYEFGNLTYRVEPGKSATRIVIFPNPDHGAGT